MNFKDKQYYIRKAKELLGMFAVTLAGVLFFLLLVYLNGRH